MALFRRRDTGETTEVPGGPDPVVEDWFAPRTDGPYLRSDGAETLRFSAAGRVTLRYGEPVMAAVGEWTGSGRFLCQARFERLVVFTVRSQTSPDELLVLRTDAGTRESAEFRYRFTPAAAPTAG